MTQPLNRLSLYTLLGVVVLGANPAAATFPFDEIDCGIFDIDNPDFLAHDFGFANEISYSSGTSPEISSGFQGFRATAEKVAAIDDFVEGAELPTGGVTQDDLFGQGVTPPPGADAGRVWQTIQGQGDLGTGFQRVDLKQRQYFSGSQTAGPFTQFGGESKGYAPFEVFSPDGGPVDVRLLIDLFAFIDVLGGGAGSQGINAALLNVTNPQMAGLMDGINGFYFADENQYLADFQLFTGDDPDNPTNVTESGFFFGGTPGEPQAASFFYEIVTQVMPGETYAIGAQTDAAIDLQDASSAVLNSENTFAFSIIVDTPGAAIVLPGLAPIPEPASVTLLAMAAVGFAARRRS